MKFKVRVFSLIYKPTASASFVAWKGYASLAWIIAIAFFMTSCSISRDLSSGSDRALRKVWSNLKMSPRYHVGLSIYDVQKGETIFRHKDDNLFTAASSTKILTMYTALQVLEENLDAAWYTRHGDSLIFWGGGDPGTLYPHLDSSSALIAFIKQSTGPVVFSNAHFQAHRFGTGWAWDDYPFPYQCERTAFPIYGNRIWIERTDDHINITPSYLRPLVFIKKDTFSSAGKSEWGDSYFYTYHPKQQTELRRIPISFYSNDLQFCWSEATAKDIVMDEIPFSANAVSIKGSLRDTLVKYMMRDSDNFVAEHLLLASSMKIFGKMQEKAIIDLMKQGPLRPVSEDIAWVDGSGLSRYNQMTPRAAIWLLQQLLEQKGLEYIRAVFPAGGQSGTLKDWYKGKDGHPYVFAKTGSLGHVQCLSGYLVARSGRIFIFSWMHNHFQGPSAEIKAEMEKLFTFLYERY